MSYTTKAHNVLQAALTHLIRQEDLTLPQTQNLMDVIWSGEGEAALLGAILAVMAVKGACEDELFGAAEFMRAQATQVHIEAPHLIDIVGTGGDGSNLFNVSTASAIVAASLGACVAKHGGRGVSSTTGSSDVLTQAGANLALTPNALVKCLKTTRLGFLFAPNHHAGMRHIAPIRAALGVRTLFNLLGPLTNPAPVKRALIGVFDQKLCAPFARVLHRLGYVHAMVVHGQDGVDEISLNAPTHVAELQDEKVREYTLIPEDLGMKSAPTCDLKVQNKAQSLALIQGAFEVGVVAPIHQKARHLIALNAGCALYVAGCVSSQKAGVKYALTAQEDGRAKDTLTRFITTTQHLGDRSL